ncbi:hypothetical protein BN14_03477 [Rhizoctonia solani AG-1 IB]|uniref:Uncharacterized protein n=1 Tax=Thanatephorus cucumeris (strain AG1-IB / isolate 7/3/14) TaxID=1108050 RepID=M5BQI0_THACB|nr:hypothetical protein BN14_03477 [Rhizoctonia solani AG-1 IB]
MVNFAAREDCPPTYDVAVGSSTGSVASEPTSPLLKSKDTPYPQPAPQPQPHGGMLIVPALGPGPTVYRYHNPRTGELVSSLLPPNHPEMICLQQGHIIQTRYGILGARSARGVGSESTMGVTKDIASLVPLHVGLWLYCSAF